MTEPRTEADLADCPDRDGCYERLAETPATPARDLLHTLATNAARHNREAIVPPTLIFDALREPTDD